MNLIICCTPLQVLIAEKIIDLHPEKAFFGVMLHTVENAKFEFYKARLKEKCKAGFFSMLQHSDRVNLLKEILQLKSYFKGKVFEKAFLANLPELHLQFLLSFVRFNELNTFDDGTVNIVKNSPFLKDDPNTFVRKTINFLLGNKYSTAKLRALSKAHYTIYAGFQNIIENTVALELISNGSYHNSAEEPINILLGQPVYADDNANVALAKKVIEQFNIDAYFPHPREKYRLDNVSYIDTPLIFEDYIFTEFSQRKCRVFTYFSSAIINLLNKSENIEMAALKIDTQDAAFNATYDLFEELGIKVIDIR